MKTKTNINPIVVLLSIFIILASCGQQKAEWKGTIEEVDGVTVVKNPIEPLSPEMKIIFEEDLTIGVEEGDENYMFGSEVYMNTDDEGNFYVTDWERRTVKKYDQEGKYLNSIGRPGQGPGEFRNISEVKFDSEGNIYLNDTVNRRISILSKDGNYIRGIKVPSDFERVIINSKGFLIAQVSDDIQEEQVRTWDYVYGLFDVEFNLVEEFFRLPQEFKMPTGRDEDSIVDFLAGGLSVMAFQPSVNYIQDKEDYILFGYPENYEIKVYHPDGKLMKIIQRDFEPVKISEEHKEDFLERQGESYMAAMPPTAHHLKKKVFSLVKYPKYKPAYEQFVLMENGWIFVVVDSIRKDLKAIDIFNKDGEYLAQFEIDISTEWLSFNNGKAYAVATEGDYKFIKRYSYEILGYEEN